MQKKILYIGLGKMGLNMVKRLLGKGYDISVFDLSEEARKQAEEIGAKVFVSISDLVASEEAPRTVWIMVPHQVVDDVLGELVPLLSDGDTIIEGGNSRYTETVRRAKEITSTGIRFVDAGVSGGPGGALNGAAVMVGGLREDYDHYEDLFKDLSVENGYGYMGDHGAGHFVKMVHNGIEYGMMQAIGEGFELMKKSGLNLDLVKIAKVYENGTVVSSRLVTWLKQALEQEGPELSEISGEVSHSGEGLWTVETAKELGVPIKVIEDALQFRVDSQGNPSYSGQVVSAMREQFGGHPVRKNPKSN